MSVVLPPACADRRRLALTPLPGMREVIQYYDSDMHPLWPLPSAECAVRLAGIGTRRAPDELVVDSLLAGRYRILRTLHHGGMSVVYLAEDTLLG